MVDVEKALLDPGLVFKTPQEVLTSDELSREQKIEICADGSTTSESCKSPRRRV